MRALNIAATGMSAQALRVDVIANNIANISTTGFKRARAEFSDLLYQAERLPGASNRGASGPVPEGAVLGLGVQTAAIRNLHTQGVLTSTGNKFDLALNGKGWFQITGPTNETVYTRTGSFNTNANGQLVTSDGYIVIPSITIPQNATEIIVSKSGLVSAKIAGQTAPQTVGQLIIANFANDAGLEPLGSNLFRQTTASGSAVTGVPGDQNFATVRQGYLENSNVDPVKEISELIAAQRGYEMNSKVVQAADEMAAIVSKNLR